MDGGIKPAKEKGGKKSRAEREEEIRKKYDFSVIRTLRQKRGLTIEKFAKLCGLSYAPISRIETNLIKPNLDTLDKIADGLGITTYNLVAMAEKRDAELVPGRDAAVGSFRFTSFGGEALDLAYGRALQGSRIDRLDIHDRDFETLVVRTGRLRVVVNDKEMELGPGDAVRYDRVFPHQLEALEDCELILLSTSGN